MKPTATFHFAIAKGIKGPTKDQVLKGTYTLESVTPKGFDYEPFSVVAKSRGVVTLTTTKNPRTGPREAHVIVNNAQGKRITGLFFVDAKHPTAFVAGSPPDDADAWLGTKTPAGMTVIVYQGEGSKVDRAALFQMWLDGELGLGLPE